MIRPALQANRRLDFSVRLLVLVLFPALSAPVISAETTPLENGLQGYDGADDNSIYEDRPGATNGGHSQIYAGSTVGSVRRALIRFDLRGIPSGSRVVSAELRLVMAYSGLDAGPADSHELRRLGADWGEGSADSGDPGGLGAPAAPGDATWNERHFGEAAWIQPGGDAATSPSATRAMDRWNAVDPAANVEAFEGEGMAADVQAWVDSPESNFGWLLLGRENGSRNARRFHSGEADRDPGGAPVRPRLTVTWEPPPTLAERIRDHLLGRLPAAAEFDRNGDGAVDAADLAAELLLP